MQSFSMLIRVCLTFLAISAFASSGDDHPINNILEARHSQSKIPFPVCDDATFMRRAWIDITGGLPDNETLERWWATPQPWDRAQIVDEALQSDGYVSRWTHYLEEMFHSQKQNIETINRNKFHLALNRMVADNLPWNQLAYDLLTWEGTFKSPFSTYNFWAQASVDPLNRQDTLDDQISYVVEKFLGIQISCISCHDGAYHLEDVNTYLAEKKRTQFWEMAAFLSKTGLQCYVGCYGGDNPNYIDWSLVDTDGPGYNAPDYATIRTLSRDTFDDGEYIAETPINDGMRPPREGGTVQPRYLFTGETPRAGEPRRHALARMITEDRQFARSMVNRLWKHFIGRAFVEPLNSFDPLRMDKATAEAHGSTIQPNDLELLEVATDMLIDVDYDLKAFMKLIATSSLYQLDYKDLPSYEGEGVGPYWGGNTRFQRLEAQSVARAITQVAEHAPVYMVRGFSAFFDNPWDFPDSTEPNYSIFRVGSGHLERMGLQDRSEFLNYQEQMHDMLVALGQGDRSSRTEQKDVYDQAASMALLNSDWVLRWVLERSPYADRMAQELAAGASPTDITEQLYKRVLMRPPTASESETTSAHLETIGGIQGVRDIMWALINHPDFLYR